MIEKQFPSDQFIIDCLNNNYDIKILQLTSMPLGADIDASVYKALASNQSSYFVKIKRRYQQNIGVTIQQLLHDTGIQQIISPIKTNHGKSIHYIDGFDLIVYPFIEGQDGFSKNLTESQWIALGKALRQIHKVQLPTEIKEQIKQEFYSSKWREAVRAIYVKIDTQQIVTDKISLKLLKLMKEHRTTIERLINRAEELEQKIQKLSPDFALCHSDVHAGNVLLADNGSLYIVDWDQPIMAPKERDLMFIGGGVGNIWNNLQEEEWFYQGYGKIETNIDILAYYRYERIIEDIAIYSQQILLTTDDGKNKEIMYQYFIDMFKPCGVIEIAFNTNINL